MVFSNKDKILIKTHKYTPNAVIRIEELKLVHLKCNLFGFSSMCAEYLQKFEFLISWGSTATCLRWGGQCRMGFVANFIRFPALQKLWKSVKIWQSYKELKGGNFFETQCSRPLGVFLTRYDVIDGIKVPHALRRFHRVYDITRALWSRDWSRETVDAGRRLAAQRWRQSWRTVRRTNTGHYRNYSWRCSSRRRNSVDPTTAAVACPWLHQRHCPLTSSSRTSTTAEQEAQLPQR